MFCKILPDVKVMPFVIFGPVLGAYEVFFELVSLQVSLFFMIFN